ncbi:hypothetical protein DL764_006752 [Monosporascus ibericus]|uniref:Amidoligase enzyme n=1 Tax=Monosporascus ibericus TaxID=155417 RepID=A0A4Q4T730_9PEZI|nr:hypothetical protein DL764_006752 [Monosporascus ibericus]
MPYEFIIKPLYYQGTAPPIRRTQSANRLYYEVVNPTARDLEDQRLLDDDNNTDPTDTDLDADGDVSMGAANDAGPGSRGSTAGGGGAAVDIAAWQEQQAMEEDSRSWSSSSPLRSSGGSSVAEDPGDDYGSKDESTPAAGGKLTYGIELEFLMAVDAREPEAPDPHPANGRWLARYLFGENSEAESFQYTVRNRCVDALRRAGVVVNKTDEIDLRDYSMGASEEEDARKVDFIGSLEDMAMPDPNDDALRGWSPGPPGVITPVHDTENRACAENIQRAVRQLREEFRIHKPISAVRSGVHVHWGHQDGWTLLQLKRFASVWVVIDESLFRLHRSDRSNFNYCRSLREHSRLAYALSPENPA